MAHSIRQTDHGARKARFINELVNVLLIVCVTAVVQMAVVLAVTLSIVASTSEPRAALACSSVFVVTAFCGILLGSFRGNRLTPHSVALAWTVPVAVAIVVACATVVAEGPRRPHALNELVLLVLAIASNSVVGIRATFTGAECSENEDWRNLTGLALFVIALTAAYYFAFRTGLIGADIRG